MSKGLNNGGGVKTFLKIFFHRVRAKCLAIFLPLMYNYSREELTTTGWEGCKKKWRKIRRSELVELSPSKYQFLETCLDFLAEKGYLWMGINICLAGRFWLAPENRLWPSWNSCLVTWCAFAEGAMLEKFKGLSSWDDKDGVIKPAPLM